MKSLKSAESNEAGFTLLEVIVALAIMTLSLGAILSLQSNSINAVFTSKQLSTVARLAQNTMIDTEVKLEGRRFEEVSKKTSGAFEAPHQDYRWEVEIKEIEFPQLDFGKLSKAGAGGGEKASSSESAAPNENAVMMDQMVKIVTKYLTRSLREIQVTIFWKKPGGEQSFTLSTWWVDLNQEFELNG